MLLDRSVRQPLDRRDGFTLIALIVLVLIIGFIVAILFGTKGEEPSYEPPQGNKPPPFISNNSPSATSLPDSTNGSWHEHGTDPKALAPNWFKESFKAKPLIRWLPFTDCSPLVRASALTLALLVIYFIAMCVITYPHVLPNMTQQMNLEEWTGKCFKRFACIFLLLPLLLIVITFGVYWLLYLLCIAFVGEEYYIPMQFTAFLVVVFTMLGLILVRFSPLVKLIKSQKFILVQLGVLGVIIEVIGLGFTLRDVVETLIGLFK